MAIMLPFTEETVRQYASAQSFERGQQYFRSGAVSGLARRGTTLEAQVEGSEPRPYAVRVALDAAGIVGANCTCAYDWGGWCQHIVAALLAALACPDAIEARSELTALLAPLSADHLRALLLNLAERDPAIASAIEARVALLTAAAKGPGTPSRQAATAAPTLDPAPIRRQVRALLRGGDRYEDRAIRGAVRGLSDVLAQAWEFIRAGDGRNALVVLDVITDEYTASWYEFDDSDGDGGAFFSELGAAWPEALLSAELTQAERQSWVTKLTAWQDSAEEYGIDSPFAVAIAAAEAGWDDPALAAVLRGDPAAASLPRGPWYDRLLHAARLNVLERQGRLAEYLRLAEAAGLAQQYLTMLARQGRAAEAVEQGLRLLTGPRAALALAKALDEQGETARALQIGAHGLTLTGDGDRDDDGDDGDDGIVWWDGAPPGDARAELAGWLRDRADAAGNAPLALQAARVAFDEERDLASYLRVRDLAGDAWPALREELLTALRGRQSYYPQGHIDIFLHEGLLADAMAVVERGVAHNLLEQVVDAAITEQPLWAITQCQQQAAAIMNEGRAQYYESAVRWLAKAKRAYLAIGRADEWQDYLTGLLQAHARKYKLRPMLEALR